MAYFFATNCDHLEPELQQVQEQQLVVKAWRMEKMQSL
jgi:hypothetical protein